MSSKIFPIFLLLIFVFQQDVFAGCKASSQNAERPKYRYLTDSDHGSCFKRSLTLDNGFVIRDVVLIEGYDHIHKNKKRFVSSDLFRGYKMWKGTTVQAIHVKMMVEAQSLQNRECG